MTHETFLEKCGQDLPPAGAPEGYLINSFRPAAESAVSRGFTIVLPESSEILIDLDDEAAELRFIERFTDIRGILQNTPLGAPQIVATWTSKSGKGRHVVVDMRVVIYDTSERIAWQALLGSDYKREAIALLRRRGGIPTPSRLFKPPGANEARPEK